MRICPQCGSDIETENCPFCDANPDLITSQIAGENEQSTELPTKEAERVPARKKCPDCGAAVQEGARACVSCGLIFFTKPAHRVDKSQIYTKRAEGFNRKVIAGLLTGIVFVFLLYHLPTIKMLFAYATRSAETEILLVSPLPADTSEFDRMLQLSQSPAGLTWNGTGFVLGQKNSYELIVLTPTGDRYALIKKWAGNVRPLTWNGKELIGHKEKDGWFADERFTIHHDSTLNILREHDAPPSIGGLAWDGAGYWATTMSDPPLVYRLNKSLEITARMVSPSSNCGGIAWDGSYLWFLDDVTMKIFVLDVKGVQVQVIEIIEIPIRSPTGIAFDGKAIWIGDTVNKRILRLQRRSGLHFYRP